MSDFFGDIEPIRSEGPESRNPLAFKHYEPNRIVMGKRMEDHLRMAVCYWHSFCWPGGDPFGDGVAQAADGGREATAALAGRRCDGAHRPEAIADRAEPFEVGFALEVEGARLGGRRRRHQTPAQLDPIARDERRVEIVEIDPDARWHDLD